MKNISTMSEDERVKLAISILEEQAKVSSSSFIQLALQSVKQKESESTEKEL